MLSASIGCWSSMPVLFWWWLQLLCWTHLDTSQFVKLISCSGISFWSTMHQARDYQANDKRISINIAKSQKRAQQGYQRKVTAHTRPSSPVHPHLYHVKPLVEGFHQLNQCGIQTPNNVDQHVIVERALLFKVIINKKGQYDLQCIIDHYQEEEEIPRADLVLPQSPQQQHRNPTAHHEGQPQCPHTTRMANTNTGGVR